MPQSGTLLQLAWGLALVEFGGAGLILAILVWNLYWACHVGLFYLDMVLVEI